MYKSFTPEQWSLYAGSMDCNAAANALNAAFVEACQKFDKDLAAGVQVPQAMHNAMEVWWKTAKKYSKYGACDTEPRVKAQWEITCYVTRKLGLMNADTLYNQVW